MWKAVKGAPVLDCVLLDYAWSAGLELLRSEQASETSPALALALEA